MSADTAHLDETADWVAITRLQRAYADTVDRRDWARIPQLFLPDTVVSLDLVSRPSIDVVRKRLTVIPGRPVAAYEAGAGCAFATRCGYAEERCGQERPELVESGPGSVSCIRHAELADRLASVERSVDV